jgi:hypothetical protein
MVTGNNRLAYTMELKDNRIEENADWIALRLAEIWICRKSKLA